MSIRILIADDHGVLRAGLTAILSAEPDIEVVGEASTGEEALALATNLKPDVVLMDISMPEPGGIETTRRFSEQLPGVRVLILTMHEDNGLAREAIRVGASGYLLKRVVATDLINAIHVVVRGDLYVHPSMMRNLLTEPKNAPASVGSEVEPLTTREIEILRLVVQGYTNNQIAKLLCISIRTVEYHRANLMGKLNIHSRVGLVRYAAEHGIT